MISLSYSLSSRTPRESKASCLTLTFQTPCDCPSRCSSSPWPAHHAEAQFSTGLESPGQQLLRLTSCSHWDPRTLSVSQQLLVPRGTERDERVQESFRNTHHQLILENLRDAEWKNLVTDLRLILTFLHSFVLLVRVLKCRR